MTRLVAGTWLMAIAAWGTVITGTYIVYPWYRAAAPKGADLTAYPRSYVLANPSLAEWHNFGMEWKEHIAWFAPILATVVAFVVLLYGKRLADSPTNVAQIGFDSRTPPDCSRGVVARGRVVEATAKPPRDNPGGS